MGWDCINTKTHGSKTTPSPILPLPREALSSPASAKHQDGAAGPAFPPPAPQIRGRSRAAEPAPDPSCRQELPRANVPHLSSDCSRAKGAKAKAELPRRAHLLCRCQQCEGLFWEHSRQTDAVQPQRPSQGWDVSFPLGSSFRAGLWDQAECREF